MDIEATPKESYKYGLVFRDDEVEAVRAAYREHIYYLAVRGGTGSIDVFEHDIARDDNDGLVISTNNPENDVANILEQFHERTDEAIMDVVENSGIPPFLNTDIAWRHHLGEIALGLVEDIREKVTFSEFREGLKAATPEDFLER